MSEIINPQDAELEEIILGSCLIESKAITLIADILRPEAFYNYCCPLKLFEPKN